MAEEPRTVAPTVPLPRHDEDKERTIKPREDTKKPAGASGPRESDMEPQTPAPPEGQGNSFQLDFPREEELKDLEIRWNIKVPKTPSEGPKINKDLCCLN